MITYKPVGADRLAVVLDNKVVGHINPKGDGFQYVPKGSPKMAGLVYKTIDAVKASLEEGHKRDKHIVVDLDGTVAERDPQSPYDDSSIDSREPIKAIIELVLDLYASGYGIIFVSGRKYNTRQKTVAWIEQHMMLEEGNDYHLFMRGDDDNRSDDKIKLQIWEDCIDGKFPNIKFVLDDRDQVVKMWRSLGLTCLQVADGNF